MSVTLLPEFKVGGTFSLGGYCNLPAGNWVATCDLRKMYTDELVGRIKVTLGPFADGLTPAALEASAAETALWLPASTVVLRQACWLDLRFAEAGGSIVQHTLTYYMTIIQPVTKGTP